MITAKSLQELLKKIAGQYTSKGYVYINYTIYPEKKKDKWKQIDKKLNDKYALELSKWQRAYRKRLGHAKFAGLRYDQHCFIMHTAGNLPDCYDDAFTDIVKKKAVLQISKHITLEIFIDDKTVIKYSKRCYQGLKEIIKAIARDKRAWFHKSEIQKIKNLPAVSRRMHLQKEHLLTLYKKECHIHGFRPLL